MLLRPRATPGDCAEFCRIALASHVAAVCVPATHVADAAPLLRGSDVKLVALISHPFGHDRPDVKALACRRALQDGAQEVEIAVDLARFGGGDPNHVRDELRLCAQTARETDTEALVRAVIDTGAYDDRTLVYFHKEALATNIWNVSIPFIPKHVYEKTLQEDPTMEQSPAHVELEKNPVTCGPYRVVERTLGSSYLFERRDDWFLKDGKQIREKPYFKQVRMRVISELNTALLALKKGEIDEMELSAEQWVNQTNDESFYEQNTKASGVEWTTYLFTWNLSTPFFSDVRVRKAMGYAFNHKELLEKQNFGLFEAANGPYHQTSWMSPKPGPAPYTQDLDKAEALLDEAGWVDSDNDGIRDKLVDGKRVKFEFSIICTPVEERKKLCTLLKDNLGQIGVICNVSPLDFAVLQERTVEHKFQAAFGGWGAGADPDLSFNIYGTNEGRNYGLYSNSEVDRLFKEARGEFDREKRAKLYARIHELIYEDQPMTYLFTKNSFYAFSKKLRGYRFSPRGPYHYGPGAFSLYKVKN